MNKEDIEDKSHFPFGTICMIAYIFSIISLCMYWTYIFFHFIDYRCYLYDTRYFSVG